MRNRLVPYQSGIFEGLSPVCCLPAVTERVFAVGAASVASLQWSYVQCLVL